MAELELHADGARLHAVYTPARRAPVGSVVLMHGLNSDLREFGSLPDALADAGLHVLAYDQRGFGRSGGERGLAALEHAMADVEAAVQFLRAETPGLPFGLFGHSLGAALSLGVLGRTSYFEAAGVAHVVRDLMDELTPLERAGYHLLGRLDRRRHAKGRGHLYIPYKIKTKHLFVDPDSAGEADSLGLLMRKLNVGNYELAMTMDAARWAEGVRTPMLVVQSPHDDVVNPARSEQVYEAIPNVVQRMDHAGGHSCFLDLDGEQVCQEIAGFFRAQLGGDR